jgi:hypothetical protein
MQSAITDQQPGSSQGGMGEGNASFAEYRFSFGSNGQPLTMGSDYGVADA